MIKLVFLVEVFSSKAIICSITWPFATLLNIPSVKLNQAQFKSILYCLIKLSVHTSW